MVAAEAASRYCYDDPRANGTRRSERTRSTPLSEGAQNMAIDLGLIKTIVVVMMENCSFDNLLGYLSLDPSQKNVDGIVDAAEWRDKVASVYNGTKYRPFLLTDPYDAIDADPPHERPQIATQMGTAVNGI